MQYSVGVFANDLLVLTDLLAKIDMDLPAIKVTVYATEELAGSLPEGTDHMVKTGFVGIKDEDVIIVLGNPGDDIDRFKDFDGTVIDLTGRLESVCEEVFTIEDPVTEMLKEVFTNKKPDAGILNLPVSIFGKSGVEDLLGQSRNVFAFGYEDPKVFFQRIAFNVLFGCSELDGGTITRYREGFLENGFSFDVRIFPLSTAFILDVFNAGSINLPDGYKIQNRDFNAAEVCELDDVYVRDMGNGSYSFVGDFIRLTVKRIMQKLQEI